jgi:NAD(P)-dependent dehydrogenase (short-subunit alcohol dehydrogenase family)
MITFDLHGKVAVVTGASSGLGVQFAKALAEKGAKIALVARREDRLQQVKEMISKYDVECAYYPTDVSKPDQVKTMIENVVKDFGRIDILVNNAGIATVEPTETHDLESWGRVIDINLNGVFYCTRYAGEVMVKQRYGKVINISSMYGQVGNMFGPHSAYHASKGAVTNFTRAVAAEWAKYNITVNAIGPGFFASEMTQDLTEVKEFLDFVNTRCPMKRLGEEGELDGTLILLASDESSYITGQTIYVDGGWTAV